ncbi:MAG TPA: peptidase M48 [Nitrospiraceae bacterium]|nr:peptidase M48 [Nitrospiraceae bacterium]
MKYTPKELQDDVTISNASPLKEFFVLLGGLLGILLVVYVALGFAVELVVSRLSPEYEEFLGGFFANRYDQGEKSEQERRLQQLLDDLAGKKGKDGRRYRVHVVQHPNVNAAALPGGHILIFDALISEVESENELSFVLAHELGHFANRDHLRGFGRGLVLLVLSTAVFGQDSSISGFFLNSLQNVEVQFSQRQEKKADLRAVDLLQRKYGHVSGATDFLEDISKMDKKGRVAYFFATHPYPRDRITAIEEYIVSQQYVQKEKTALDPLFR